MKRPNKNLPDCPLRKKLKGIRDAKQAINNSKMTDTAKRAMMAHCDREWNQAWRRHYEGKPGYEIVHQAPMRKVRAILMKCYNMSIHCHDDSHVHAKNDTIIVMAVAPNDDHDQWLLRIAPYATFDRWANSTVIEKEFDTADEVAHYLKCYRMDIYKKLLESLSREVDKGMEWKA